MPELRSRARRNRTSNNHPDPTQDPKSATQQPSLPKRRTIRTRNRTTAQNDTNKEAIGVGKRKITAKGGPIVQTRSFKADEIRYRDQDLEVRNLREGVGEKAMDEYDSGGRSADKGPAPEDEGGTAPLPEKVDSILQIFSFSFGFPIER